MERFLGTAPWPAVGRFASVGVASEGDLSHGSPRASGPLSGREVVPQGRLYFSGFRKAAGLMLGIQQLAVELDIEDAALPFDELGIETKFLTNLSCQTGSSGMVVSNNAIFYRKLMGHISSSRPRSETDGIIWQSP